MLKSRRVDLILSKGHLLFQYLMLCVIWSLFWIVLRQPAVEAMAARIKVINLEEWEKKINDIKITKEDMNKLVMNFLLIEGYVDAAEKFYMETGTEHIDLTTVTDRMAVKSAVESGNVEEAIEKLKVLNPKILDTNCQLFFRLQQQRMIELIKNGKNEEALDFGKELLAPMCEENQSFLKELERTVSLLVFENVIDKPHLLELLDMSRCLNIASELNAAILTSQGLLKDPNLPTLMKMFIFSQSQLCHLAIFPVIRRPTYDFVDLSACIQQTLSLLQR
ncbi:GID8-like protein [Drosera capensis]